MPALGYQGTYIATTQFEDWNRPHSVDTSCCTTQDDYCIFFQTPESEFCDEMKNQSNVHRRNKLATKFSSLKVELPPQMSEERERTAISSPEVELTSSRLISGGHTSELYNDLPGNFKSEINLVNQRSEEACCFKACFEESKMQHRSSLQPGLTTKPPLPHHKTSVQVPQTYDKMDQDSYKNVSKIEPSPYSEHGTQVVSNTKKQNKTEPLVNGLPLLENDYLSTPQIQTKNGCSWNIHSNGLFSIHGNLQISKDTLFAEEASLSFFNLGSELYSNEPYVSHQSNEACSQNFADCTFHENETQASVVPCDQIFNSFKETDLFLKQLPAEQDMMLESGYLSSSVCTREGSSSGLEDREELQSGCLTLDLCTRGRSESSVDIGSSEDRPTELQVPVQEKLERIIKDSTYSSLTCLTEKCIIAEDRITSNMEEIKGSHVPTLQLIPFVTEVSKDSTAAGINSIKDYQEINSSVCEAVYNKDNITVCPSQEMSTKNGRNFDLDASKNVVTSTSTYDDIVNILKVLEEEETSTFTCSSYKLEGLKLIPNTVGATSEGSFNPTTLPISGKLEDILTYLDAVDQSTNAALISAKIRLRAMEDATKSSTKCSEMLRLEDLLNMGTVDLAHEVLTLKLQLEEKGNGMVLLQDALNQQRELTVRNTRNADRDMKTRLKQQKQEYEAIINRHQKFIDQLIADKKMLSEKCESVVKELKTSDERHASNLKASEERHNIELQRAKETFAAAEKLRRERWIDNRTQKIKEMTVKGLEPELQRMSTRYQQELSDLRTLHKQELEEMELRAVRRTAQQMEQLREQLTVEKEEAFSREKEFLRQKLEKQVEQEEANYQEQRRRLLAEVRREKERLAEEEARMKDNLEQTKQNLGREYMKDLERTKREYEESLDAIMRRHQNELKMVKESLEIEKEAWIHNYKKQQAAVISEREGEIREKYKRERDREIELVIERLENEAMQARTEQEQAAENRLRRLKEKFDAEVKDLEASEETIKSKYDKTKCALVEKEDELINLKANIRQLEKELQESRKITDRLSAERADMKEIIKKEFTHKILLMEQENVKLKEEMAEIRARQKLEVASKGEEIVRIKAEKEKELNEVYTRVKAAIANKDKTIQHVKAQHESAQQRCVHLEELLEQQRRDFLLK